KLTENIFIGNTDGPEADILSTTPATCQEANGTAVLSPVIYSYEWCDGATGFTRSNLPAGICFVTVTDPATNCSNVLAVHIDEFSPLTVSPIINAEPDCNQANGEVTISVTGGSTNYTYQWSDNGSGSPNRTDLAAGIYSVTVSDNGPTGCITTITFTLNNQLAAGAEVTINGLQAISCAGQTDGEVFFDVTPEPGFVLPFTASIVNEQGQLQVNGQLEAGSYCIVVQDANACFAGEACFELGVADALVLDIDISALTCTEDGRIEILATGGSGNYQYDWADLPGANDPRLRDDLVAGLYSITVSDQNGCTAIANDLEIIDDCGICPFASTEHLLVLINESETICAEIEDCFDPSTTTFELLDGGLMGSSIYGAYELGADGCLTFSANSLTGEAVDTICILADDGNLLDTTCIIISITDNPLINPGIDTIFLTTNEVTPVDTCLTTIALPNDFASTTIFYDPVNGTGTLTVSSLDSCVTYTPNPGQTGNFIDTMGVILCDVNDICDTFILVTSVIPDNCPDIVSIDTASIVSFDCSFGGTLCLDIDLMDVFDYDFSIDGQPYTSGFSPCDIDTVLRYELQPLLDVAPIGPYELSSWEFDGQTFSIDTFFTVETLVDSMNVWDTEGNWMIVGNTITGGITYDTYGELQIMQLLTQIDVRIDLNSIEVPNGSQIVVDSAAQLLLINELATGCVDSVFLNVECNDCPAIYDGPDIIMASDCEGMADLCLNLDIRNIQSYQIFDNQLPYSGLTTTCDFDTLLFYSYAGFSTPDMYTLDEWIVDGDTLTLDFMTIQELLDAMNDFDPDGDWSITGLIISGGDSMSDYGPLVISLNGTLITTSSPIPQLVPNGIAIQLDTGFHQIIVQDTLLGCIDTLLIDVICDDFTGGGIDTLLQIPEMSVDTFCIDISAFDTVTSIVNVCPNLSNGNVGFSALSEAGCFELIGEQIGLDTFCMEVCDELAGVCDTFNLIVEVTPVIDTLPVEVLIGFTDTLCINVASLQGDLDTIYNYCEAASGTAAEVLILETTQNCVELTGFEIGMDTACIVICDVEGFCDTTILVIEVIPPQIDTISETVLLGETDRYCIDTSELALTVDTIYNICENASGSFVDFSLEADSLCVFFEGLELGIDTACIVICDEGDFCDTTILIVEVLPQISAPPVAIDDDTTTILNTLVAIPVLANDSLNGSLVDIFIITDPLFGQVEINPDFTFTYVPDPNVCEVTDSFEYVIVTETGSDTATVSIFVMCDQLTIFSGFSPNDDGINDTFTILGIENFPNNRVYIFNRWGNEVYVQRGYTQANAWDGRWKGNDLPDGTYFYVIEDGEGNKFSGYVQLHR
ncbi:MAG: gliding motility-associated C-terminal domain-containing protein, partial [Bacteroidota bacterium]